MTILTETALQELASIFHDFSIGKERKASRLPAAPVLEKGILYGYAATWYDNTGDIYIDSYPDHVAPGSWKNGIRAAENLRKRTGNPYLMPHLWQHSKVDIIGGVLHLEEDSMGVVYSSQLAKGVRRADEALNLAKISALGTSYGYDRIKSTRQRHPTKGDYNHIAELMPHEISSVTFPANPYTSARVKGNLFSLFFARDISPELVRKMYAALDELEMKGRKSYQGSLARPGADIRFPDLSRLESVHTADLYATDVHTGDLFNQLLRDIQRY